MSAIRPLATIAALMLLGYFLYNQISTPDLQTSTENELALDDDLPPLSLDLGSEGNTLSEAPPAFAPGAPPEFAPGAPPAFEPAAPAPAPKNTNGPVAEGEFAFGPVEESGAPGIQPLSSAETASMPELPPLPVNIPKANYADAPVPGATPPAAAPPIVVDNNIPSLGEFDLPPIDDGTSLPPLETPSAPLDDSLTSMANQELAPPSSAFATARPAIEAALKRGELQQAHLLLTQWYGDRSLTADERNEVESLLSQLAGTVIYSTDHRLEAPYRVKPGDTLETIAQAYNVPWQLLAKINGISQATAVMPGQELKVLRGPFSAVVDVERQQLALVLSDRYAGRFSVKTEGEAAAEGEWVVTQKQMPNPAVGDSKIVVLEPASGAPGTQLVLGPPSDTAPKTAGAIRVAPQDQNDLFDILSIGSRVMIRK